MSDYIPFSDAKFDLFQENLVETVVSKAIPFGIPETEIEVVVAKQTVWKAAYPKASNKQNRTPNDVLAKVIAHDEFVNVIRPFVAEWLTNNSKVSDIDRAGMGLTVRSGTRTPVPKPTTSPVASIDISQRKQHSIRFSDENTPRSKAKPEGVHGCEIFMKVDGEAPKVISELMYQTTCTASPYVVTFDGTQTGKVVYYWLRWVNTRGECGPWSITINAVVS